MEEMKTGGFVALLSLLLTSDLFIHLSPWLGQVGASGGHALPVFKFASGGAIMKGGFRYGFPGPAHSCFTLSTFPQHA